MSYIAYPSQSPYAQSLQTTWYLGVMSNRAIPADRTDQLLTLSTRYSYRPDKLAFDLYGTPAFWWIFMQRNINLIRDPIWDMVPGLQLYCPTKQRLTQILGVG